MARRALIASALPFLLLLGCGRREETRQEVRTPYGTVAEVSAYLASMNPYIERISQVQIQYEEALSSAREDATERKGTGRNLAERAASAQPDLRSVLEALDAISPPPLLAPFHRDTRKLVATRLEAYSRTLEGWEAEQAGAEFGAAYRQAEAKLDEANQLILQLNEQMQNINASLLDAAAKASSGSSS